MTETTHHSSNPAFAPKPDLPADFVPEVEPEVVEEVVVEEVVVEEFGNDEPVQVVEEVVEVVEVVEEVEEPAAEGAVEEPMDSPEDV
jgi:hypothetical protein